MNIKKEHFLIYTIQIAFKSQIWSMFLRFLQFNSKLYFLCYVDLEIQK
jgi:hypothetical protein